jgi:hypothetical protein
MNRFVKVAIIGSAALTTVGAASAQELVRPRWNAYGSPVCPRNYDYLGGWCRPVYGEGYRDPYAYRGRRGYGRYGGETVPPRWTTSGSAVCPRNYEFDAGVGLCVSVY